jgi:nuclear pore complex protein Nup107
MSIEQIARDLETLLGSKFAQGVVEVSATVGVAPGECPARLEGEYGQVVVQISTECNDEDRASLHQDVSLAMADCVKGDLPGQEVTLDVQSVGGSSETLVHALCRAICVPSLVIQAAQVEAATRTGTTQIIEMTADPKFGVHKYFAPTELRWLLELGREIGLTILDK